MHVKLGDGRWLARCLLWGLLVVGALEPYALRAGQWEFIKIADANADATGSGGFRGIQDASLRNGVIAFRSSGGLSGSLWQYAQGTFTPLLAPGALFPGTDQPFYYFDYTWADDEIWIGGRVANGPAGLFRWDQGQLVNLVPSGLADPLTQLPFQGLQTPLVQAPDVQGRIVFSGQYDANNSGIYRYSPSDGSVETILDRNTLVPGHNVPFNRLSRPVQLGDRVLFAGGNVQDQAAGGLYEWRDGQIVELAPEVPTLPPPPGYQTSFFPTRDDYGYLGSDPLFTGEDERHGPRTLYRFAGTPQPLASDCLDPDTCVEEWRYLYGLAIDPSRETLATTSGSGFFIQRLSYWEDGQVETVLDGIGLVSDLGPLLGISPPNDDPSFIAIDINIGAQALDDRMIAFRAGVESQDPPQARGALFLAIRVPEPATGMLFVWPGIWAVGLTIARLRSSMRFRVTPMP